ncbi:MAG: hypothetical protein ACJAWC_001181 [Yoonia sp.]|jgi:hypothetical protein
MTPDIRKTVDVPLTPTQAFDLFTRKLDTWWPSATHSVSAANDDTPLSIKIDPRKGGKITEKLRDGTSATWGTVTHWSPGNRIDINWHVGRGADEATQVTVMFTSIDTGTRVDLIHSGFDSHRDTAMASLANYTAGWDLVLGQCFLAKCRIYITA